MEAPLNAREFLKRFHLPQLVRLSFASERGCEEEEARGECVGLGCGERGVALRGAPSSPSHSNTSISSSFVALGSPGRKQRAHERSNWTFADSAAVKLGAERGREAHGFGSPLASTSSAERGGGNGNGSGNGEEGRANESGERQAGEEEEAEAEAEGGEFCSISAWSPRQLGQLLGEGPGVGRAAGQLRLRVPRASLAQPGERGAGAKRSVDFQRDGAELERRREAQQVEARELGESLRLAPPDKRPALSKLQLNQPFLLYKAHTKLELSAYVLDLKNELSEKSGDPIHFPHNYPGKPSGLLAGERELAETERRRRRRRPMGAGESFSRSGGLFRK